MGVGNVVYDDSEVRIQQKGSRAILGPRSVRSGQDDTIVRLRHVAHHDLASEQQRPLSCVLLPVPAPVRPRRLAKTQQLDRTTVDVLHRVLLPGALCQRGPHKQLPIMGLSSYWGSVALTACAACYRSIRSDCRVCVGLDRRHGARAAAAEQLGRERPGVLRTTGRERS